MYQVPYILPRLTLGLVEDPTIFGFPLDVTSRGCRESEAVGGAKTYLSRVKKGKGKIQRERMLNNEDAVQLINL